MRPKFPYPPPYFPPFPNRRFPDPVLSCPEDNIALSFEKITMPSQAGNQADKQAEMAKCT
jgi:hypothetical protein